jgi:hypothetical protein
VKQTLLKVLTTSLLGLSTFPVAMADGNGDLYQPLGFRLGSFMAFPSLEIENDWNDNIYYRPNNEKSDFILHVRPELKIRSNWSRHSLNLTAGTDAMFYKDYTTEDRIGYFASLDGRFDVLKNSFATGRIYYQNVKENRGSPEPIASRSVSPLENETLGATIGYQHKINRLRFNVSHDIQHIDFQDGVDPFGDVVLNSQRNRYVNTSEARVGYELFSGYEAYLKGSYNFVDYENPFVNQNNLDRSSQGYAVVAGVTADITHTLVGDAYIGYRNQDYDSAALKSVSGMAGGLAVTWLPTQLTTVTVGVDRNIMETTQAGLSGYFSTMFSARAQHKLRRNVLADVHASYTNNDYIGTNLVNRQEDVYNVGLYFRYLIDRHFYVQAGYDHYGRSVNLNNTNYDMNNVYLTVGTQL